MEWILDRLSDAYSLAKIVVNSSAFMEFKEQLALILVCFTFTLIMAGSCYAERNVTR